MDIFVILFDLQEDEDSDDDSELSDFDLDETTLETYLTPIDDEDADNPIDEYIAFQQVITRMCFHILWISILRSCHRYK